MMESVGGVEHTYIMEGEGCCVNPFFHQTIYSNLRPLFLPIRTSSKNFIHYLLAILGRKERVMAVIAKKSENIVGDVVTIGVWSISMKQCILLDTDDMH